MPLFKSIVLIIVHALIALGLNFVVKELGWINHSEVMTGYFVLLALIYKDNQLKFEDAYHEDPDLVEAILRDELT